MAVILEQLVKISEELLVITVGVVVLGAVGLTVPFPERPHVVAAPLELLELRHESVLLGHIRHAPAAPLAVPAHAAHGRGHGLALGHHGHAHWTRHHAPHRAHALGLALHHHHGSQRGRHHAHGHALPLGGPHGAHLAVPAATVPAGAGRPALGAVALGLHGGRLARDPLPLEHVVLEVAEDSLGRAHVAEDDEAEVLLHAIRPDLHVDALDLPKLREVLADGVLGRRPREVPHVDLSGRRPADGVGLRMDVQLRRVHDVRARLGDHLRHLLRRGGVELYVAPLHGAVLLAREGPDALVHGRELDVGLPARAAVLAHDRGQQGDNLVAAEEAADVLCCGSKWQAAHSERPGRWMVGQRGVLFLFLGGQLHVQRG
mmetsp:Transcript_9282/g.26055  ORF Transcript_9282/g.26055 Transcript_9282/m.26055 type:complete len:374 (+) Transcript_9282:133-1254(+)